MKNAAHVVPSVVLGGLAFGQGLGSEVAVRAHLADGTEFTFPIKALVEHGRELFAANWTVQEGAGRPLTDGTGGALSDPSSPLVGPRAFNRVSGPDANSCAGCHDSPYGIPGGGGDFVANVFVLGQRFDFATFDDSDPQPLRGGTDESGAHPSLQEIANSRATPGMFGSGFIEMLARQMTTELRSIRDGIAPGAQANLVSKGVSFGVLKRNGDGTWDTSLVTGLSSGSLSSSASTPPSLVIKPFHQAGAVISLRQFSNNAYNHHHGIQSAERFGPGDVDGDGFTSELSIADVTAVSVFQATMAVPGRVIPRDPAIENAVRYGEELFAPLGCAQCHVPYLPLAQQGWLYSEPNPFNPAGNLAPSDPYVALHGVFTVDLTSPALPRPRLTPKNGVVWVPAFTDLKLHDLCAGPSDPNREPLDMHAPSGSQAFFGGNEHFVTKKLWGCANEPPYFHHGRFTTLREAVLNHFGEADAARQAFEALTPYQRDCVIEFLKSLQVLKPGTNALVVDERGKPRNWPSFPGYDL